MVNSKYTYGFNSKSVQKCEQKNILFQNQLILIQDLSMISLENSLILGKN